MDDEDYPLMVEQPREIELLGSQPLATAVVVAVLAGVGVGLLVELGSWMYYARSLTGGLKLSLIVASAVTAALVVGYALQASRLQGERFSFWPDRFERSGPGGTWLVRYGEIETIRFVSRGRVDVLTREGQPRSVRHMVYSFMQRLQQTAAEELSRRLRQQGPESGRPVVFQEPLSFVLLAVLWTLRFTFMAAIVWYCMALFMRTDVSAPFETGSALVTAAVAVVLFLLVARFGARRTVVTDSGVRQGGRVIAWSDVERLVCDMDGIEIRSRTRGTPPCRITWHATNVVALPEMVAALTPTDCRVDLSQWASPWQLMGADPVSLAPPDFD